MTVSQLSAHTKTTSGSDQRSALELNKRVHVYLPTVRRGAVLAASCWWCWQCSGGDLSPLPRKHSQVPLASSGPVSRNQRHSLAAQPPVRAAPAETETRSAESPVGSDGPQLVQPNTPAPPPSVWLCCVRVRNWNCLQNVKENSCKWG